MSEPAQGQVSVEIGPDPEVLEAFARAFKNVIVYKYSSGRHREVPRCDISEAHVEAEKAARAVAATGCADYAAVRDRLVEHAMYPWSVPPAFSKVSRYRMIRRDRARKADA